MIETIIYMILLSALLIVWVTMTRQMIIDVRQEGELSFIGFMFILCGFGVIIISLYGIYKCFLTLLI